MLWSRSFNMDCTDTIRYSFYENSFDLLCFKSLWTYILGHVVASAVKATLLPPTGNEILVLA